MTPEAIAALVADLTEWLRPRSTDGAVWKGPQWFCFSPEELAAMIAARLADVVEGQENARLLREALYVDAVSRAEVKLSAALEREGVLRVGLERIGRSFIAHTWSGPGTLKHDAVECGVCLAQEALARAEGGNPDAR